VATETPGIPEDVKITAGLVLPILKAWQDEMERYVEASPYPGGAGAFDWYEASTQKETRRAWRRRYFQLARQLECLVGLAPLGKDRGGAKINVFEDGSSDVITWQHQSSVRRAANFLDKAIVACEHLPSDDPILSVSVGTSSDVTKPLQEAIFLVHGRSTSTQQAVARFLGNITDAEVVILDEQASRGMTLIEKFEAHADRARFAVVLLDGDDVGGLAEDTPNLKIRARQNVIFELGYFFGKLGRDCVCVLYADGVERPSDVDGLVYVLLDAAKGWMMHLGKELRAGGIDVDMNRI